MRASFTLEGFENAVRGAGAFACGVVVATLTTEMSGACAPATGTRATYPFPYPDVVSAHPPRARADAARMARTTEREDVGFEDMTDSPGCGRSRPRAHGYVS
jgi:hypothetical protein